ncbi:MAG: hypothetical protein JNK30_02805 [Phenylobacterium sp.]|uniref:DUF6644 family protein n=1 Tax=Phenylobacterium sp. TaxID=1871053 RepID=UPI001A4D5D19|nr:DUF6644 family protein [Phenylobacterium sp.]MBL8770287.1 hypothetical protein [Phenylobacterium sp.]
MSVFAPQDLFPQLAGWVANLDDVFPGKPIKDSVWAFAQIEVGHLLSLAVLGGTSLLLNLRLIGVGLTDEPPRELHRNLAVWTWAGLIVILISGLLMGASNAERLYTSEAFTAKMIGLAAGILMTFGFTLPATRNDGVVGALPRAMAVIGLAIFLVAVWVFLQAKLANPGLWHVIVAGGLIVLFASRGLTRLIYLGVIGLMIVAQQIMTHVVIPSDAFDRLDPVNKGFAWAFALVILAFGVVQAVASGREEKGAGFFVKGMAFASVLVWVMTAAAGRWLAFA